MNIAYLRISTNLQTTEQQKIEVEKYAKANNIPIDLYLQDEGISAYNKTFEHREGMLKLLELVENGKVENVIVFESSRISRKYFESLSLFERLTQRGIAVHSVVDNCIINKSDLDNLLLAFKSYSNMQASKLTGERVKAKQNLLKEQGKHYGGGILWGFKLEDGYLIPNESLIPTVKEYFNNYILYGSGYLKEKYNINTQTTSYRIRNKKYIAIVGEQVWEQANKLMSERTCRGDGTLSKSCNSPSLFEGLLLHKECKHKLYIYYDNRGSTHRRLYRCKYCRGNEGIKTKKSFTSRQLEPYLETQVLEILENLNNKKLIETYNSKKVKKELILELKIKNIEKEITENNNTIEKANKRLQEFILSEASEQVIQTVAELITNKKEEINSLNEEKHALELSYKKLIQAEKEKKMLINNILKAKEIYNNASFEQKKSILQLLINRIEVTDVNEADIYLNI